MDDPSQRILVLNECDQSKTLVLWKERKRWPPEYSITHPFMHGIRKTANPFPSSAWSGVFIPQGHTLSRTFVSGKRYDTVSST